MTNLHDYYSVYADISKDVVIVTSVFIVCLFFLTKKRVLLQINSYA